MSSSQFRLELSKPLEIQAGADPRMPFLTPK